MKYLIANWKAEMNETDVVAWIEKFKTLIEHDDSLTNAVKEERLEIIICPSYPFITYASYLLDSDVVRFGSQSISPFIKGKYTGEVTAHALMGIVEYTILGHSERRNHCLESENILQEERARCREAHIEPILCVRDEGDMMTEGIRLIAYEPVQAIGSGNNLEPQIAIQMKRNLNLAEGTSFIYGGSVDVDNISEYDTTGEIDGYLVGTASLDPVMFYTMATKLL